MLRDLWQTTYAERQKGKNQNLPPLENREEWGTPKFKIDKSQAHPASSIPIPNLVVG